MKEELIVKLLADTQKATAIRDKLMKWTGVIIEKADQVHLVMRINGKDVRYECAWIKELLK
jgi:hypothetical protein